MLIDFSVGNYRSFKEKVTLSMVATDLGAPTALDRNNVFQINDELSLLKSSAIYGANASGKSNLVKAIAFMNWFIINSSKQTQITDSINIEEFKLSTETIGKPSFFEIIFLLEKKIYRYGFEVNKNKVVSEWLFYTPATKEYQLFTRDNQDFDIKKRFKEGDGLEDKTRKNALFLSVVAQFNGKIANKILFWFEQVAIMSGVHGNAHNHITVHLLKDRNYRNNILQLIKKLDLSIDNIRAIESKVSLDNLPPEIAKGLSGFIGEGEIFSVDIKTAHKKYDSQGQKIALEEFDMEVNESEGTKKLFAFAGPILNVLREGRVLWIDELDARLHPLITKAIINLFNSQESNPNNAQLIFMTHDTNLLSNKMFRRDQIWFVEKNKYEESDLYSLVEYNNVSDNTSFENDYIKGKYGAIPYINISSLKDLIS